MTYNDIIGDMLTKIRNGYKSNISSVIHINSIQCNKILDILYEEGYIRGYKLINNNNVEIMLKYINSQPAINQIIRISKPGRKIYYSVEEIKKLIINNQNIFYILSTSRGIITSKQVIEYNVSGEVLCKIM
jgi:small subunit ribosomal protein S8